ncbi:hypothetical protein [Methanobrevibacter sp.]|uniref:hypothetical protein n=1 Tax=Methanobrevibacter sp. TaxID=66852 RepID=UPI00388D0D3B
MARGGYYQGSDYVPYQEGTLSKSSATSVKEITKQKTVICPNCKREVPKREYCLFCDNKL